MSSHRGPRRSRSIATPGHTPACVTYRIDDALFTGDALFMHDYGTGARTTRSAFVAMRTARDRTLAAPRLLYPSVQVNIDGGRLPPAHANGRSYLSIPITESPSEPIMDVEPTEVRRRSEAVLVDVREPQEFSGELGHVPGAQLVPLARLAEEAMTWDRGREIILVCRSGGRSAQAATELAKRGFRHLYNLRGGMIAWNANHLPVER
ncbi:MAG: rhodanese-like domain-containing protein [Kofleriaceae bacterium]